MKILHVTPNYLPAYRYGGPIYSVHGLCRSLAGLGHEIHVYTTNADGAGELNVPIGKPINIDGIQVWYFSIPFLKKIFFSLLMKNELHKNINIFDLVHTHTIYCWPSYFAAKCARKSKVPYVMSPRGMLVKEMIRIKSFMTKTAWINFFEKDNLENASAIHATSDAEKNSLLEFSFAWPKIVTIPNGVDVPDAEGSIITSERDEPYILFLSRIDWKKGLDRLIPAMRHVTRAKLIIAGECENGYRRTLDKLINEAGVSQRIKFIGPVYGKEKEMLFRRARLFVLPSYNENFGNVVLEAMAWGCPVIVTPQVGAAEHVIASDAGVVCDGDPDKFGGSIDGLLSDTDLLKKMGQNGWKYAWDKMSWDLIAREMASVYEQVVKGKMSLPAL